MNKKIFEVTSIENAHERNYLKNKSHLERMEALERLRMIVFGYDPSTTRLQRTIRVTQLKKG